MNHRLAITLLTFLITSAFPASANAAESIPFKIGYFDADEVYEHINDKQRALIRLVESPRKKRFQAISLAAKSVAKQQNLDVIIDKDGVWVGQELVTQIGQNVEEEIITVLAPKAIRRPQKPQK